MAVESVTETAMIWGTVSGASMLGMVISLLLSVGLPIFLGIFIYKKTKAWVPAFFIGCGIFVGFAMILEQICHAIVLTVTGDVIRDNIWLYAIYGGLAAALFEECGRWIAMKFCLKKHLTRENALMYGAGHGGIGARTTGGDLPSALCSLDHAGLPVLPRTDGANQCDRPADRVVDSCIQCGEDRQKVAFGSSLRTAFCSGLSDCGVCLHDSYMGIGAGIADGGCSDLCSGIQAGLCIVDREKGLTETKTIR